MPGYFYTIKDMLKTKNLKKIFLILALLIVLGLAGFGLLRVHQRSLLVAGIEKDDAALIAKAFSWGFPKNAVAEPGVPALSKAVLLGHARAARALVEQGVNLQAKLTEKVPSGSEDGAPVIPVGTSPLGVAAFVCYQPGTPETARLLFENGASPDERADNASLAEIVADVAARHPQQPYCWEMLESLLEAGLNVNSTEGEEMFMDAMSGSPLWVRLVSAHIPAEKIETLISRPGVDLNAQSKAGITALMQAAVLNRADIAEILLKSGADPNVKAPQGFTALEISKQLKHPKIDKLLRAHGAVK